MYDAVQVRLSAVREFGFLLQDKPSLPLHQTTGLLICLCVQAGLFFLVLSIIINHLVPMIVLAGV